MQKLKYLVSEFMRRSKLFNTMMKPLTTLYLKNQKKHDLAYIERNQKFQRSAHLLLEKFRECCDGAGLKFWLTSGTLLGAYREHKLLGHDLDLDVAMFIENREQVKEVLSKNGFTLEREFGVVGSGIKEQAWIHNDNKIDIVFMEKADKHLNAYIFFKDMPSDRNDDLRVIQIFYPETDFIEYDFLGSKYLIPEKTVEYLTANYGKNFMKPDKYWDYTRDIPSAKYYTREEKCGFYIENAR